MIRNLNDVRSVLAWTFIYKVKLSCHWSDGGRGGRDLGSLRRSPLGVIMSQIRRKRSFTDKKPLGRFLSWGSERIPEDGESGAAPPTGGPPVRPHRCQHNCDSTLVSCNLSRESLEHLLSSMTVCVTGVAVAAEGERELGWGRVRIFLYRLGKTFDSRSLSLAHCDLTATDLLELGG